MRIENPTTKSTANDQQVDGSHYQTEIQPWDFIEANQLTFVEGNIVKYVARHRKKNGVRDLMKAKHYLEKLIEIEQSKTLEVTPTDDPDLICPTCEVKTKIKEQDRSKSGVISDFICLMCSNQFN